LAVLFAVGTPIGNLEDLSDRAKRTLASADAVICEDTRVSGRLLAHLGIKKPLISFHSQNEHKKTSEIITRLKSGENMALITDAGMPAISDPGFLLIREAHLSGIAVQTVPGPSSLSTALALSGLPSDRFVFEGFLPHKKGRKTKIQELSAEERTVVLFESPHRIVKLLKEWLQVSNEDRMVAVCRELTKKFEEVIRGSLAEVLSELENRSKIQGEIVVVIAPESYTER
jgi:16S rRNA (cytidine1402-2'-O)-methyltransferase